MRRNSPEANLQRLVVDTLTLLGYRVFETGKSRSKVRCTKCGASSYATGWQGNTPGLPDLYIHSRSKGWKSMALAIELKAQKGVVSPIQQEIADLGMSTICWSLEDVLEVLMAVEEKNDNWMAVDKLVRFINGGMTWNTKTQELSAGTTRSAKPKTIRSISEEKKSVSPKLNITVGDM